MENEKTETKTKTKKKKKIPMRLCCVAFFRNRKAVMMILLPGSRGRMPIRGIPRCGVGDRVLRRRLHCAGIRLRCGPSVRSCDYHQNVSNMWTVKSLGSCMPQRSSIVCVQSGQFHFNFRYIQVSQTSRLLNRELMHRGRLNRPVNRNGS